MTWTCSGFEPEIFSSASATGTDSEAVTSLSQREAWVSFTSFAIWQNTDLAKCLSHLPIPRLLGALGTLLLTLSAHFPVRSATGMLFKMEENGCISPVDLLIPGISGVQ